MEVPPRARGLFAGSYLYPGRRTTAPPRRPNGLARSQPTGNGGQAARPSPAPEGHCLATFHEGGGGVGVVLERLDACVGQGKVQAA